MTNRRYSTRRAGSPSMLGFTWREKAGAIAVALLMGIIGWAGTVVALSFVGR